VAVFPFTAASAQPHVQLSSTAGKHASHLDLFINQSINQNTLLVFKTHQGSQQTITMTDIGL